MTTENDGQWRRVVIEKPFGHDLASAKALNAEILKTLQENQIYRIDHFLGKETVQNVMALRFANGLFEPLWNRQHIDHVQITVALLRRHIGNGSQGCSRTGQVLRAGCGGGRARDSLCSRCPTAHRRHLGQAKIQNLGVSALGYEDVCGLNVAVNNAFGLGCVERISNVDAD